MVTRWNRHLTQEYSADPLAKVQAGEIMVRSPETLPPTMAIDAAATFLTDARHRSYPVVDTDVRPVGLESRGDAVRWMQDWPEPNATLGDLVSDSALPCVGPDAPDRQGGGTDAGRGSRPRLGRRRSRVLIGLIACRGWRREERDRVRFATPPGDRRRRRALASSQA